MENIKNYLTIKGWKKDFDETAEDVRKLYRFITRETPEETKSKDRTRLMERICGKPLGLPKGVIHSLKKLERYCYWHGISFTQETVGDKGEIMISTRLGKANYKLYYSKKGDFKDLEAEFSVNTGGQPLFF